MLNDKIVEIAFGDGSDTENNNSGNQTPNGSVDHAALFAVNNDSAGWLMVEGTDISLPIVYSKQELFYLRRDFDKKKNVAGTVFMDFQNNKDFADTNTMVFGHNMKNGSMFSPLQDFLKEDFFQANKFIYVSTPERAYKYEIFAVYQTTPSRAPYMPGTLGGEKLNQLLAIIDALSLFKREAAINEEDKILTLATCGYNFKNARALIHAKLVEE